MIHSSQNEVPQQGVLTAFLSNLESMGHARAGSVGGLSRTSAAVGAFERATCLCHDALLVEG